MGEFDLSLILEFRNRPCLYDRNSQQFKDKLFTAQQWQEISNKLGYDVSILKDRMLQLRNRYNLEKRRIEQLREENPEKIINSPWPLFESLQFLSGHIKARRRYKNMLPVGGCPKEEHFSYMHDSANDYSALGTDDAAMEAAKDDSRYIGIGSGGSSGGGGGSVCQPFPNALLAVKVEENFSEDQGSEVETDHSQNNESESNIFGENSNVIKSRQQRLQHLNKLHQQSQQNQQSSSDPQQQHQQQMQQQYQQNMQQQQLHIQQQLLIRQQQQHHQQQQQQMKQHLQQQQQQQQNHSTPISNGGILRLSTAIRGGGNDSDKQIIKSRKRSFAQLSNSMDGNGGTNGEPKRLSGLHSSNNHRNQHPVKRLSPRELKYNAFGNFVSSSLMDLPQKMALELVEKFTSDIVKALTMKMDTAEEEEESPNNTTPPEEPEVVVEE